MRRDQQIGCLPQRMPFRQRFGISYVQSGSDSPLVQPLAPAPPFRQSAPRCIHQRRPGLHPGWTFGITDDAFLKLTGWSGPQCRQTVKLGRGCRQAQPPRAQYARCERTSLRTEKAALRLLVRSIRIRGSELRHPRLHALGRRIFDLGG